RRLLTLRLPRSPLFPYTTLFRSLAQAEGLQQPALARGVEAQDEVVPAAPHPVAQVQHRRQSAQAAEHAFGTGCAFGQRVVDALRSEEHTSELQSRENLVCRLLLE